MIGWNLWP